MHIIAHIENDLPEKFGIPRQSGIVSDLQASIVFEPEYRNPDALRGLEGFSHIWLLWEFENMGKENTWSPTVRPPRLGGNTRLGVFATRSPNRPNPIGLSSVRLLNIEQTERGPILHIAGADLRDKTPIYDIKPYLPYADSHPDALGGFAADYINDKLDVIYLDGCDRFLPPEKIKAATSLLAQDPRPSYHNDPTRIYGMSYAGFNIQFHVNENTLTVINISPLA